jgi:hypothetical protein
MFNITAYSNYLTPSITISPAKNIFGWSEIKLSIDSSGDLIISKPCKEAALILLNLFIGKKDIRAEKTLKLWIGPLVIGYQFIEWNADHVPQSFVNLEREYNRLIKMKAFW